MTSQLDNTKLLELLESALIEADGIGNTLAAALIAECIASTQQRDWDNPSL